MIEPGTYTGVLQSVDFGLNEKETPTLTTEWLLDTGETRTVYTYLSDRALEISMKKLAQNGFNGDFANPDFATREVELRCKHETYEGEPKERWDFANWGSSNLKEASGATIASLNAKFKAQSGGGTATPPPVVKAKKDARTACWEAFTKNLHGGDQKKAAQDWDRFIADNVKDKTESELTDQEWNQLEKLTAVPFA